MYKHTLNGDEYTVHVCMAVRSYTATSRGDHYAGDGEYEVYYGTGEATVRDQAGHAVAVCGLGYTRTDHRGFIRPVNDEAFKGCVEVVGLLPERQKAYADWIAHKFIEHFRTPNQEGMPGMDLVEPDRKELIEHGFIADVDGQSSLPLYDTSALTIP